MKYKFCSIRINEAKYDVAFATKEVGFNHQNPPPAATPLV